MIVGQKKPFTPAQRRYQSGPFEGKPIAHPYKTVLSRLEQIGISAPVRQVDETAREYILRLDRTYPDIFGDIAP
ncbi:MAG: hypothetical protein WBF88_06815 [Pusillimonas sp.]